MQENENPFQLEVVSIRLVKEAPLFSATPMTSPCAAVEAVGNELREMDREVIWVINMTTKGVPINGSIVSMGILNAACFTPREMLKSSILSNADGIIMLHNHPSGDLSPSNEDVEVTKRLKLACECIGIRLLDHIIVGANNSEYYSFLEHGLLHEQKQMEFICEEAKHSKEVGRCR